MAKLQNGTRIYGNAIVDGNLVMGSSFRRNRIHNGNMAVAQRGTASQTFTAGGALAYTVDRWYGYCTGANVTGIQVANTGTAASPSAYAYQFTGAASVTAIGFGQRIEAANCYDLAGTTATLSVNLSNSLLSTVTWTAYYANTTDTFGTLASPTVTQIATGTFSVSSTLTNYNVQIAIPSAATTGIQIVFSVGAQISGTWIIGNVQLEAGTSATPYERIPYYEQLANCQRYYYRIYSPSTANPFGAGYNTSTTVARIFINFPITMRTTPSALEQSGTAGNYGVQNLVTTTACTSVPAFVAATTAGATISMTTTTAMTAGNGVVGVGAATTAYLGWSVDL